MDFYKALSDYYDIIFPFSDEKFEFLKKGLGENAKILDVGSGTGTYSIPFARIGYKVFSFDYEEKMVEIMLEKGAGLEGFIPFKYDMDNIDQMDSDEFNLVYCIGNTLVHLGTMDKVNKFFKSAYGKIADGGKLIIQTVNYDKVFRDKITELPFINREDKGVSFKRTYQLEQDKIKFIGTLSVKTGDEEEVFESSTELMPVLKEEFDKMAMEAGFKDVTFLGGYNESEYTNDSNALIMICTK